MAAHLSCVWMLAYRFAWGLASMVALVATLVVLAPASAAASSPASGTAADFGVFYSFRYSSGLPRDVEIPTQSGVIQSDDGRIYGVARAGGGCTNSGGVYSIGLGDASDTVLHSFLCDANNNEIAGSGQGYSPGESGIVDGKDGWYYGTTQDSYDSSQAGQIYRVKPDGSFQVAHAWSYAQENGHVSPSGRILLASDGFLYGVTTGGGACGTGTVYRLDRSTLAFKVVYSFCHTDGQDAVGVQPVGGLVQGSDGALYGTTEHGGASSGGNGTVFRLAVDANGAGTLTTRLPGSSWNFEDDPHGLTVTR